MAWKKLRTYKTYSLYNIVWIFLGSFHTRLNHVVLVLGLCVASLFLH